MSLFINPKKEEKKTILQETQVEFYIIKKYEKEV